MQDSQSTNDAASIQSPSGRNKIDLSFLPPVYVLAAHLSLSEQHDVEEVLSRRGARVTYDIKEANLVLGNISKTRRARSELHWKDVRVEEVNGNDSLKRCVAPGVAEATSHSPKKRKIEHEGRRALNTETEVEVVDSSTASETEDEAEPGMKPMSQLSISQETTASSTTGPEDEETHPLPFSTEWLNGKIAVAKIEWLSDSLKAKRCLPIDSYIIYEARLLPPEATVKAPRSVIKIQASLSPQPKVTLHIPKDPLHNTQRYKKRDRVREAADQDVLGRTFSSSTHPGQNVTRPTKLLHQTTSEDDEAASIILPSMPDWVLQHKIYSCERATPLDPPNNEFICQLKKIRLARVLTLDDIGVRAYSTSIAALAAYPHQIETSREVLALPGCDQKIAHLFHGFKTNDGHIQAVADIEADPALTALREFYEIWGVGAVTAREFYYDKKWRSLDDIVENGWKNLHREQQIGLKYYDEFQLKITRPEVESIAATIAKHAKAMTGPGLETIIVGGYRRGKPESGDADVILTHPDETKTQNLIDQIVNSLTQSDWVTHELTTRLTNSKRNQEPLPLNTSTLDKKPSRGFDTLDKAFLVWQTPHWPTKKADLAADPEAKNPNPHRRVDIIISPWRTIGCAVAGWTSGTTFQRDLRRYAKHEKGWKFDSSGVRERGTGKWVDLEGWRDERTRCVDWRVAERRVFEGLGLVYREPWDRCTG